MNLAISYILKTVAKPQR